jgi:hypothetical protein
VVSRSLKGELEVEGMVMVRCSVGRYPYQYSIGRGGRVLLLTRKINADRREIKSGFTFQNVIGEEIRLVDPRLPLSPAVDTSVRSRRGARDQVETE